MQKRKKYLIIISPEYSFYLVAKKYSVGIPSTDYRIELPCLIQNISLNPDGTGLFKANIHGVPEG